MQRTFTANAAATNTSCQEIPSQDTRREGELAKKSVKVQASDIGSEMFKDNDRVQWSGGRLWANQIEEDTEEGEKQDLNAK